MSPRRYEQRARAEAAEETRRRILDAVYRRLREAPAQALSVDAIAADAGVARSTVYVIFGSRAGLFDAFAEYFFDSAEISRLSAAFDLPDAREVLRGRGARLMRVLRRRARRGGRDLRHRAARSRRHGGHGPAARAEAAALDADRGQAARATRASCGRS